MLALEESTIRGEIMYLTRMVDKKTLENYERETKEKIKQGKMVLVLGLRYNSGGRR